MSLEYHAQDYQSSRYPTEAVNIPGYEDQYGGQLKAVRWHSPVEGDKSWGYAYKYDNRYQFGRADWGQSAGGNLVINPTKPYQEMVGSYDPNGNMISGYDLNGNISALQRNDYKGQPIAQYLYYYQENTNRLSNITHQGNPLLDYTYDDLGQLTQEKEGNKTKRIVYDVTGKVTQIMDGNNHKVVSFTYDDRGFRLSKTAYDENEKEILTTWYVRDASGSVMSTYEQRPAAAAQPIEVPVYGATRIGVYKPKYDLTFYELTDHLGNVRAVIGEPLPVEYLATMETERIRKEQEGMAEPGKEAENDGFTNMRRSQVAHCIGCINHTPNEIEVDGVKERIVNPNEVLKINNSQAPNPIGVAKMMAVSPGDVIKMEVKAKYANFDPTNKVAITGLTSYLSTAFGGGPLTSEGLSIFRHLDQSPTPVFSALEKVVDSQPKAFLTYILYDNN
jgi:YD repeat-containing protein